MRELFPLNSVAGFGADPLRPQFESPPFEHVRAESRGELRKLVRRHCPKTPGVYGMLDPRGRLIYVGKAKLLRNRLLSYFLKGNRHEKAGRIIEHSRAIVWEPGPCEFAALIRELELIRRWRPGYNVQGQPGRERQVYLCIGRKPAPYVYATREPKGNEIACFGPIKGAGMAREAARRLNDLFHLRDCSQRQSMHFAEQGELFPIERTAGCLRYELGTCLGPCAGLTTRAAYSRHVRAVRDFLEGRDLTVLNRLESKMYAAAERQDFELAAALRDKMAPIQWLRTRLTGLDEARKNHSFIYPVESAERGLNWYLIRQGRVCSAVPEPTDAVSRRRGAEAIREVYAAKFAWHGVVPSQFVDHVLLVAGWFRRRPEENRRVLSIERALEQCRETGSRIPLLRTA